jgi:imidazole glycerol-phosphate synthase subunit HisF
VLKTRLIPCLLLKNGLLVRSEEFSFHQLVGNPINQVERFNAWAVDELIYIDITREGDYDMRRDDHKIKAQVDLLTIIEEVSRSCFMPLTFGGGIRTVDDIRARLAHGADKVTINTQAVDTPEFITEAARTFGSQAIIVSIDTRRQGERKWEVYTRWGKQPAGIDAVEWAKEAEHRGAGEIFLNSIERDGMASGYDLELIEAVSGATRIPVIACGGVGKFPHLVEGVRAGASAVSAANIFHFTEHSTQRAKKVLAEAGVDVRLSGVMVRR